MKLTIYREKLYINGAHFCFAKVGNGRPSLPTGRYPVSTQYAHAHGKTLPDAVGLGWLGSDPGCDIVLGSVRGRHGVHPSQSCVSALLAKLEVAEDNGQSVWLEVE